MSPPVRARISGDYPERIKNIRKSRQLTQTQFAKLLGVSYASVSRWENGQARPNNLASRRILDIERAPDARGKSVAPSPPRTAPPDTIVPDGPDTAHETPKPAAAPMPQAAAEYEILRVSAVLEENDGAKAAQTARHAILAWAQERTGGELPLPAWDHEEFEYGGGGRDCAAVRLADDAKDIWALRIDEPDAEAARRVRTTEAIVRCIPEEKSLLAVRFLLNSPEKKPDIEPAVPDLAPRLVRECGLRYRSGQPLHAIPWIVKSDEDVNILIDMLLDPDRQTPVFVLSIPDGPPYTAQPLIAPEPLARATLGIATVVVLPPRFTWNLTQRFGKQLSVFKGAVRIYLPGFAEDADPYSSGHDLTLASQLSTESDRSRTAAHLCRIAARESLLPRNQENFMSSYADVKKRSLHQRRKRLEREGTSDAEQLELARMQNAELKKDLTGTREKLDETRKELKQLWDAHHELDEQAEAADTKQAASDSLIQDLRNRVVALGGNPDPDIELPRTWEEFPDWCDRALAGRVTLSQRARREAKAPKFRDVQTVARSLLWLAGDYRDRRLNGGDGDLRTAIENGIHNERS